MIDNYVICHRNRIPDAPLLASELRANALQVSFPNAFNPRDKRRRFVACRFERRVSGFDYAQAPYENDMFTFTRKQTKRVGDRDTLLHFCTFSNAQEIAGSSSVAATLAKSTDGVLVAEFEEDLIQGTSALTWLREALPNMREQFHGPCKMRGHDMTKVPWIRLRVNVEP